MKMQRFFFSLLLGLVVLGTSCNNSGTDNASEDTNINTNTNPGADTSSMRDSILSDPSKFSDPH